MTCIVHPTELSLKKRIAELEAEVERLRKALQKGKVINVNGIDYRLVRDGE